MSATYSSDLSNEVSWVRFFRRPGLASVYALCCPHTGEVRYVGWSSAPWRRLSSHRRGVGRTHVACWIRSLRAKSMSPVLRILCVGSADYCKQMEVRLIAHFRVSSPRLTNHAAGGDGSPGVPHGPSRRAKQAIHGKRLATPEKLAKMQAANRAAWSAARRKRIGQGVKAAWERPETRAKYLTLVQSQEARARRSAAVSVALTKFSLEEFAVALAQVSGSAELAAAKLGCSRATVHRYKKKLRQVGGY